MTKAAISPTCNRHCIGLFPSSVNVMNFNLGGGGGGVIGSHFLSVVLLVHSAVFGGSARILYGLNCSVPAAKCDLVSSSKHYVSHHTS